MCSILELNKRFPSGNKGRKVTIKSTHFLIRLIILYEKALTVPLKYTEVRKIYGCDLLDIISWWEIIFYSIISSIELTYRQEDKHPTSMEGSYEI